MVRRFNILGGSMALLLVVSFVSFAQKEPRKATPTDERKPVSLNIVVGYDPTAVREIDFEGLKKLLRRDPTDTKPLLVNFWATWCDLCREEFPDLVKIDNDYRAKGLSFVAVSLDDVAEIKTEVPKFLKSMNATMPNVLLNINDPEPAIHFVDATWDGQLPATFLYDKEGKVVFRHFGRIKPNELRAALDKVMSGK